MQSRLLHHFLIVAERRSVTAAAEVLHITQPALTRSIHQLEKLVGAKLFERLPTGVALTRQGEILLRRTKLMDLEYRHALAEIRALEQGMSGRLRIAAGPMWITTILPPVVAAFQKQFPRVRVKLTGGTINTMVDSLLSGDVDVMCSTLDFPMHAEIVREPLLRISHAVVARRGHPLNRKGVAAARDMARFPWLVHADDQIGIGRIGAYFAANGLAPPTIAVETTTFAMFKILGHGDYLAHFAEQLLPDAERYDLVRVPHEGTFWVSEAGLAYRETRDPIRALTSLRSMLKEVLAGEQSALSGP
jgi:DNA-binding transcriptional LysR family regulator